MSLKDPRSQFPQQSPLAGSSSVSGYFDGAGFDLGNGTAAIITLAATRAKTTPAASTTSSQILAADDTRIAVTVINNDTVAMALGYGIAAVVGTNVIAPGGRLNVPAQFVYGVINAIWATGGTVAATVFAYTA